VRRHQDQQVVLLRLTLERLDGLRRRVDRLDVKKVVRPIPRCSMIGWINADALSIVNARFSGDSSSTSLRSRRPRRRR
jgi:hypothetical protein